MLWKGFKFAVSEGLTVLKAVNLYSPLSTPAIKLDSMLQKKLLFGKSLHTCPLPVEKLKDDEN